jgi:hypothetical protein
MALARLLDVRLTRIGFRKGHSGVKDAGKRLLEFVVDNEIKTLNMGALVAGSCRIAGAVCASRGPG